METSSTEENYLKAIFKIQERKGKPVATNEVARLLNTSAASVSDMIRRLSGKGLVDYQKYKGTQLSEEGKKIATNLIRKHRLWESFLVEKLGFTWDEIHEIAEELEHIRSPKLIRSLDDFLGNPRFDPHGDPIPTEEGHFHLRKQIRMSEMDKGQEGVIVGVSEHSTAFLKFLEQQGLVLGTQIYFREKFDFDESISITRNEKETITISHKVSNNIYVQIP